MLKEFLFIIFISVLVITIVVVSILIYYVLKLIKISTKLKAKQYEKFNESATKGATVFLGDSLTEFYQLEEFFFGEKIYNRGIASDTTDGVLKRLDTNVINIEPKKVFIQIGTNDYRKNNNDYIFNNIVKIIKNIQEQLNNVEIYIISLYPVNHKKKFYSRFFVQNRKNANIIELNKMLINYCNENNLTYIDVYSNLIDNNGQLKVEYTIEGLHISYEGYEVITSILKPYVYNLLQK